MGSRKALALGRFDELESGGDSEGASATRVIPVDGKCVLFRVLRRDPRSETVGKLDLGGKGRNKGGRTKEEGEE